MNKTEAANDMTIACLNHEEVCKAIIGTNLLKSDAEDKAIKIGNKIGIFYQTVYDTVINK
ncbi:MAG: hypothetical protein NTV30_01850 [Chloroflexi bacterium]|nr:hypothetical protein [Chloroflexota bacterium]